VINSNDIDGVFVLFDEIKGFLLLLRIFSRFFVKVIIKDFWPKGIFGCGIFRGFLGIGIQWGFCGFFGHSCIVPFQAHFKPLNDPGFDLLLG
jgi:hypothetical protein